MRFLKNLRLGRDLREVFTNVMQSAERRSRYLRTREVTHRVTVTRRFSTSPPHYFSRRSGAVSLSLFRRHFAKFKYRRNGICRFHLSPAATRAPRTGRLIPRVPARTAERKKRRRTQNVEKRNPWLNYGDVRVFLRRSLSSTTAVVAAAVAAANPLRSLSS